MSKTQLTWLKRGTITHADRAMVSSLLLHSGKTAGQDYCGASAEADTSESTTEMVIEGEDLEHQESSESSADDDNRVAEDMEDAADEDEADAVQMDSVIDGAADFEGELCSLLYLQVRRPLSQPKSRTRATFSSTAAPQAPAGTPHTPAQACPSAPAC